MKPKEPELQTTLVRLPDVGQTLVKVYQELLQNMRRKSGCQSLDSIAFSSWEGGQGVTTICRQLAVSIASNQRRVLLVQTSAGQDDECFSLRGQPGLFERLNGGNFDRMGRDSVLPTNHPSVHVISRGNSEPPELTDEEFDLGLRALESAFDFVIYDLPSLQQPEPWFPRWLRQHPLVLVTGPQSSSQTVALAKQHVEGMGGRVLGRVRNRVV